MPELGIDKCFRSSKLYKYWFCVKMNILRSNFDVTKLLLSYKNIILKVLVGWAIEQKMFYPINLLPFHLFSLWHLKGLSFSPSIACINLLQCFSRSIYPPSAHKIWQLRHSIRELLFTLPYITLSSPFLLSNIWPPNRSPSILTIVLAQGISKGPKLESFANTQWRKVSSLLTF
jgi:hypothetical protein